MDDRPIRDKNPPIALLALAFGSLVGFVTVGHRAPAPVIAAATTAEVAPAPTPPPTTTTTAPNDPESFAKPISLDFAGATMHGTLVAGASKTAVHIGFTPLGVDEMDAFVRQKLSSCAVTHGSLDSDRVHTLACAGASAESSAVIVAASFGTNVLTSERTFGPVMPSAHSSAHCAPGVALPDGVVVDSASSSADLSHCGFFIEGPVSAVLTDVDRRVFGVNPVEQRSFAERAEASGFVDNVYWRVDVVSSVGRRASHVDITRWTPSGPSGAVTQVFAGKKPATGELER